MSDDSSFFESLLNKFLGDDYIGLPDPDNIELNVDESKSDVTFGAARCGATCASDGGSGHGGAKFNYWRAED